MEKEEAGPLVSTFSIVGYDPEERAWGIAIASRFLGVGAQTCWGEADVGVVVVQAHLIAQHGADGVELLRQGHSASEVIERLMSQDSHPHLRQLAVIDREGQVAAHTGDGCTPWAGHFVGDACAAQGNMLLSGEGCAAMVDAFMGSSGSLARRLTAALAVGDEVGGDMRGRQSAALYVVRPAWDVPQNTGIKPTINLRVDDHEDPCAELTRLLNLFELIFHHTRPEERLPANDATVRRLQGVLSQRGYYFGEATGSLDEATRAAMKKLAQMENFHRRLPEEDWIDARLLAHLEAKGNKQA